MKFFSSISLLLISLMLNAQTFNLDRDFGTYFGDERFSLQGSVVDNNGDLYIVGFIRFENYDNATEDFTYFNNSPYQSIFAGGHSDGFIAKFNDEGNLLWATLFGGEGTDIIENITTDKESNIYIMGVTNSLTGISTENAHQTERLGAIDMFISKFNSHGEIIWSTYFGNADNTDGNDIYNTYLNGNFTNMAQDGNYIVHDKINHLYITSGWKMLNNTETIPSYNNTVGNNHIAKFTQDGEFDWCTSYGVNINNITGACWGRNGLIINGQVITPPSQDNTYYGEENAYQPEAANTGDVYIAKFNPEGMRVWGTYYGSAEESEMTWHNSIACDNSGSIYQFLHQGSSTSTIPFSTPGAFQEEKNGTSQSLLLTKFTETPQSYTKQEREWATYYGLNNGVNATTPQAVIYGEDGFIYISGADGFADNMTTEGAWQETTPAPNRLNGFIAKFDSQGNRIWGTFYNGEDDSKNVRVFPYGTDEHLYITGITLSNTGMTTENALEIERNVWNEENYSYLPYGIFIAHFSPKEPDDDLSLEKIVNNFNVYPNPNQGSFNIQQYNYEKGINVEIIDLQGRKIYNKELSETNLYTIKLDVENGIYLVNFMRNNQLITSKKIIITK